jgi:hypothetical protein
MIGLFGYYMNEYRKSNLVDHDFTWAFRAKGGYIAFVIICLLSGIFIGIAMLFLLRRFAGKMIRMSILAMVVLYAAFGIFLILFKSFVAGVLMLVFAAFWVIYFFCVKKRIKFSEKIIKYSIKSIKQSWGLFFVTFGNVFAIALYTWFWMIGAICLMMVLWNNDVIEKGIDAARDAETKYFFLWVALVFPLFLTTETFQNVVHATVCGVSSSWWFLPAERNVTFASFKRASIWSLGSIVFGSTIVAFLRTMRYAVSMFADNNSLIGCCVMCILSCLERLMRYFNTYAMAFIATYGGTFCSAAKDTMQLFKSSGFTVLINDELIHLVLFCSSLMSGILTSGIVGSIYYFLFKQKDSVGPFFFAFICAYFTCSVVLQQLYSATVATIVCWASSPDAMLQMHPNEYNGLEKARKKMYN